MRKTICVISLLVVTTILTGGCSLFLKPVLQQEVPENPLIDLFDYRGSGMEKKTILVRSASSDTLNSILASDGAAVVKTWPAIGWALVSVPAGKEGAEYAKELRGRNGIAMAIPNLHYQLHAAAPAGEFYPDQWGFTNIGAEAGWQITMGSSDVIVAVIDTGVDIKHPEFAGKTFVGAYDATTGHSQMFDLYGHGTHVAGIAADDGRTGLMAGVAWNSPIMPIKILDEANHTLASYVIEAFCYLGAYAESHSDLRIVANISMGTTEYDFALKDAVDYAIKQDVVVVASAGNEGKRQINYPAAFNGVISVAASTPYNQPAGFSVKGHWNSVAAPGIQILSTYLDKMYAWMDGTSMSAPFVAGSAALLLAKYPALTPLEVKNQIEQTAVGYGFTEELGYGIIHIPAMLGPIKPLIYGSLNVQTNILPPTNTEIPFKPGVITVLDSQNRLAAYGMTGENGNSIFHALRPGSYTVQLSCPDPYENKYWFKSTQAVVSTGSSLTVELEVPVQY